MVTGGQLKVPLETGRLSTASSVSIINTMGYKYRIRLTWTFLFCRWTEWKMFCRIALNSWSSHVFWYWFPLQILWGSDDIYSLLVRVFPFSFWGFWSTGCVASTAVCQFSMHCTSRLRKSKTKKSISKKRRTKTFKSKRSFCIFWYDKCCYDDMTARGLDILE